MRRGQGLGLPGAEEASQGRRRLLPAGASAGEAMHTGESDLQDRDSYGCSRPSPLACERTERERKGGGGEERKEREKGRKEGRKKTLPQARGPRPPSRLLPPVLTLLKVIRLCSPPPPHLHMHFILRFCAPSGTLFASHLLSYLHCFFPLPFYPRLLIFPVLKNKHTLSSSSTARLSPSCPPPRPAEGLHSVSCPAVPSAASTARCAPGSATFLGLSSLTGEMGQ